ncbi:MAG: S9 family peptidase, partial [Bacteroidota bacterium]
SRQRRDDEKPGAPWSELWMVSASGGSPYRFTYNDKSDRSPRWSPDGKWVAFISTRGEPERAQVYLIPSDGGEARQLTQAENSVGAFKWSPDGRTIAYTVQDPKTKEEQKAEKEGRDWTVADANYKHTRLYAINLSTQESWLVTKSDVSVWAFDWSPDGKKLVLVGSEKPLVDYQEMFSKLMVVDASGGQPTVIVKTEGKLENPAWSLDGKWIAYRGATSLNDPYAGSVFVVPATGGTPENVTKNYDGTATWIGWLPKSNTIVFAPIERQSVALRSISLIDKKITPLLTQNIILAGASFSADGLKMALVANTPRHPNEVWVGETKKGQVTRITKFNPELEGLTLGEQEIVKWKGKDGWEIEGVLVKPVGYQSGRRYPAVLQAHGGPESADLNGWLGTYSRWAQLLAANGFAVLMPNYRGSIGRGAEFAKADHRDMMGKEFEDMVAGADYLIARGIADPDRIGIGGGSYGGYTAAWAATAGSKHFKASVMFMGIADQISKVGTTDIFWEGQLVHWDMILYDNFDFFWSRSPLKYIHNANTPTLILHGERDARVPIGQAHEMYNALKWKGVPTEFVTYPRAGHGLTEKAHQLNFMNRVLGWYTKYLKDGITGR